MEPQGMVECLQGLESRGAAVHELIVDNDGNVIEVVEVFKLNQ